MKKIFVIVAMTLLGIVSSFAQAPQMLTYQAVIRNGAGEVVSNQTLDVQVSILQGSVNGAVVYSETHNTSTTSNGVVTLAVGDGATSDDFSSIDWGNGPFYINSSVELNGKTISVTSQLLSVPYALYAQKAFLAEKVNEAYLTQMIADQIEQSFAERDSIAAAKADSIAAAAKADSIAAAAKADSIAAVSFKSAAKNGVLPGKFSISDTEQVHFSQGVLQYHEKNNVWRFSETQFDTLGKSYKDYWMSPANAWVDRFEFGTGGADYPECSFYTWSYSYFNVSVNLTLGLSDWGRNPIINGGNSANQWQTLDFSDWTYLFHGRRNAEDLYSRTVVDGMKGFVILPDDWSLPEDVSFTPRASDFTVNVYDKLAWSKMETAGAVFFPCSRYWSSEQCGACLNLSVDRSDPMEEEDWFDNDFVEMCTVYGNELMFVRLATVDASVADKIMGGETIAVDYHDTTGLIPNNYRPDDNVDLSNVDMTAGLLSGKFSVSESKQVNFSKGNLQYNSVSKVWRFAENQYDKISEGGFWSPRGNVDEWTDCFNWASSGYSADPLRVFLYNDMYGLGSENIDGTKYDWGVNNPISNGGNTANIWRTLTSDEWTYLLNREKNGQELALPAVVNDVDGWILLPDDWVSSSDLVDVKSYDYESFIGYATNVYTLSQWSVLESQGVVFLPCAGIHFTDYVYDADEWNRSIWVDGSYWSSSAKGFDAAWMVDMSINSIFEYFGSFSKSDYWVNIDMGTASRITQCSVRLVRDVK